MTQAQVDCLIPCTCTLGEGPVWSPLHHSLFWVDIHERTLYQWKESTGASQRWDLPHRASALAVLERDSLLLATDVGLVSFSLSSGAWQVLCDIEPDRPGNRTNDGKMDPFGRFWFGTMDDAEKASSGALYSFDAERRLRKHLDGVAISNTLAWDLERGLFYFADSARQSIYVFDYDEEEGSIANRRLFVSTVDDGVYPDGSAIDKEGYLWNCQWDGWRVVRYAPDGTIARSVPMPVQRPTSCAFGEDGTILYVTTARVGLSESDLAEQPLAGSVLRVVV